MKGTKKGLCEAILKTVLFNFPTQPKKKNTHYAVKPKTLPLSETEIFHAKLKLREIYYMAFLTTFNVHSWYRIGWRTCRCCYELTRIRRINTCTEFAFRAAVMEMQTVTSLCPYIIILRVANRVI